MVESTSARGPTVTAVPEGDNRERLVCPDCGFIKYDNPKIVVGAVCGWEDRILLCRRDIPPRRGFWTLPAGYLELNESTAEGAIRETWEEATARIEIDALLAVFNVPRISQVQLIYRARLLSPEVRPGIETQATALLAWADIPWDDIAFPTVRWALTAYHEQRDRPVIAPRGNPEGESADYF